MEEFRCPRCGYDRPAVRNFWVELDIEVYALRCPRCGMEWTKKSKS
jgi:uncharacterized C2H2 Zn-finger protein